MEKEISLEARVTVHFDSPEKAESVYLGEDWKSAFYDLDDMDELSREIAMAVHNSSERFDSSVGFYREPEGYGRFIKKRGEYILEHESTGKITVTYDEELCACNIGL